MKVLRVLGLAALAIITLALLALGYGLTVFKEPPVDPQWAIDGATTVPDGAVTVRYTGTATLLFSDGTTHWMTDGWFSRPKPLTLAFGKLEPDLEAIETGLRHNAVESLAAVIPVHSHYDHAMDAPEVARRTGAVLMGSESTANIGRGWGLPEDQIRVLSDREEIELGAFKITAMASRHFQFPDPAVRERALGKPRIESPLVPPVGAFDYRVGVPWILHVSHPKGSFLIVGSAGFIESQLEGLEAHTVFLGTGGLGSQTPEYRNAYWRETVETVNAERVIAIHWDSLTGPIEGPFRGPVIVMSFLSSGLEYTRAFLEEKAIAMPELHLATLPRYEPVILFP